MSDVQELTRLVQTLQARLNQAESRIRELEAEPTAPTTRAPPPPSRPSTARAPLSPRGAGPGACAPRPSSAPFRAPGSPRGALGRADSPRGQQAAARAPAARPRSPMRTTIVHGRNSPAVRQPPTRFFTASMRGGPLTEPMRATARTFLTQRERDDPENAVHGPSLLLRRALTEQGYDGKAVTAAIEKARAAKRSSDPELDVGEEALRILRADGKSRQHENLLDDDNPYNDGIKYWPFRGFAFPPSNYRGPGDRRQTDELHARLELTFAYGYRGDRYSSNLFYTARGKIVYFTAALGIVYDKGTHSQAFFHGHDDDIVSLALHPNGVLCATGQVRSLRSPSPRILVWSTETLVALQEISGFHQRAVICLSFSADGRQLATIGKDNSHSIAVYESPTADWAGGKPIGPPIGTDKGHNADIFEAKFNPVTNHIVACGERYLRFFGLKENPSPTESRIWAKKGILKTAAKRDAQTDILCLTFGPDGATYAGTLGGDVYVFHEQQLTRLFAAHREAVTALWFDTAPGVNRLFSSGLDGLVKAWEVPDDPHVPPRTASSGRLRWATQIDGVMHDGVIDLLAWVTPGLEAAAHALHTSDRSVLVGTVSNEIYELEMGTADGSPMCIMQGHFNRRKAADGAHNCELDGIAAHPSAPEIATCSDDRTLRVWDLALKQQIKIRMLKFAGKSCAYSPDGKLIAVGLANGGWLVVDAEELETRAFGKGGVLRREEISDIKFSPCGSKLAVASHDNFIDLYDTATWERYGECRGHSSYVTHIDWSAGDRQSELIQSTCGAYELLYFDATKKGRGKQVPYASALKDVVWASQSCPFGWPVMGIWPEGCDGTDINALARSNKPYRLPGEPGEPWRYHLVSADDFGTVRLFHYPCIKRRAKYREHRGHSSHVTNVCWTFDDMYVLSTGGGENSILQWALVPTESAVDARRGNATIVPANGHARAAARPGGRAFGNGGV